MGALDFNRTYKK